MPSSIITVQVGQCGNQLGMAFWERMCAEHGITAQGQMARDDCKGEDCKEIFFNEANCGQKWVPRAVLIDLEPRVLGEICNCDLNRYSGLFDVDNIYQGPTGGGAGNNWAKGYNQGSEIIEEILAIIQNEVERTDHLEGFALCHSILGGTGSGLGSRLLRELRDRYGKNMIQTYSAVQPMTCNVAVAPYNIVLSLDAIMEHADMSLLFDNDAFEKHCKAASPFQRLRGNGNTSEDMPNMGTDKNNYAQINSMMSQVMTSLSAPFRYYSPLYTRLMHVSAFVNPFPPMIFSQPAVAPFVPVNAEVPKSQQLIKFPEPRTVLNHLLDPRQLISSNQAIETLREKEQKDKSHKGEGRQRQKHCLLAGLMVLQSTEQDPLMRISGAVATCGAGVGELYQHMHNRNQSRLSDNNVYRSPPWMPSTMNLTSCRLSPYLSHEQYPVTGMLLANHTSIGTMFGSMANDFDRMWKKRANVHAYENASEENKENFLERMGNSRECIEKLLTLYREACTEQFVDSAILDPNESALTPSSTPKNQTGGAQLYFNTAE